MRVLVTNDDGVGAPGLRALTTALHDAGHDVTVVAPMGERSGSSAAIGPLHRLGPIPVDEHTWPELPDTRVLAIDASPATAVYVACLGGFGPVPELVASGINPGANTGHLVLHSGTVGAALTGAGLGVPGFALSMAFSEDRYHWSTAARLAPALARFAIRLQAPARVLNVNVPNVGPSEVRGVREAGLAPHGSAWTASADLEAGEVQLTFRGRDVDLDPGCDLGLVRAGWVTVTLLAGVTADPLPPELDALAGALDGALADAPSRAPGRRAAISGRVARRSGSRRPGS